MEAKVNWSPLGSRVLVRRIESEDKTPGGIVLPDNAKEKSSRGVVLAVGPGRLLDDGSYLRIRLEAGDVVMFAQYAGTEIDDDGQKLLLIDAGDCLAVRAT